MLRAPPLPPVDVEAGEVVVEERTKVRTEREEGGFVEVEVAIGKEKEKGKAAPEPAIMELLLPETVEREEPLEPTELEAEQSVVANRWV